MNYYRNAQLNCVKPQGYLFAGLTYYEKPLMSILPIIKKNKKTWLINNKQLYMRDIHHVGKPESVRVAKHKLIIAQITVNSTKSRY